MKSLAAPVVAVGYPQYEHCRTCDHRTAVRAALHRSVELGMTFPCLPLLDINRGLVLNEVPCLI